MKHLKILFATMLVTLLCLVDSDAKVVYVNATAPAGGNGTSWVAACRHLQDALDLSVAGDEVWVAEGTYYPDLGAAVTTGDRTATFALKENVKLYGGFTGGETNLIQRNPVANTTILSGEIWTEKLYWSLHVVTLTGSATLDGFTVTKGNANGESSPYNVGAGIYCAVSNKVLTLANCVVLGNTAKSHGGAIYSSSSVTASNCTVSNNTVSSGRGGAIYSGSSVTGINSTFSGNTVSSGSGGAIYSASSLTFISCSFLSNRLSSGSGGAIYTTSTTSSVNATNCYFSDNTAYSGGAISSSSVTATNCVFSGNTASSRGGAISSSSSVTATDCTFSNNTASTNSYNISAEGGAIYSSSVTATNCRLLNNTASNSSSSSSASAQGGAIFSSSYSSSSVTVTDCTFSENRAYTTSYLFSAYGGAIRTPNSSVTATNCTFSGNTASNAGGAINSSVTAMNCTFSGNTASHSGGAIHSSFSSSSPVTATNCLFSGNTASFSGGAIHSPYSAVTATNCIFSGNTASSSSTGGGGAISSSASVTATNCMFSGNTAYGAGAISAPVTATNCTFLNNLATRASKQGGAISSGGLVKIFNNIFWHTFAEEQDSLIHITSTGSIRNADVEFPSPLNQAKNLISGGIAAITSDTGAVVSLGTTSVTLPSADPLFLNAGNPVGADGIWKTADDGLRLQASSPAVDLGLSMYLPVDTYDLDTDNNKTEQLPVDLAGSARIQRAALDLGAYEEGENFLPIVIVNQPQSATILTENIVTFTVTASGYSLSYQWFTGDSGDTSHPIAGATSNSFTTPELVTTEKYWARVKNGLVHADSQTATATVVPVIIAAHPVNTLAAAGATSTLSVTASGRELSYQWYQGASGETGLPIPGGTGAILTTPPLTTTTSFWVRVTSIHGSVDSQSAVVSIVADLIAAAVNKECNLSFTAGGNGPWLFQSATTYDGVSAAQSAAITHNQSSQMQTTVSGAGTLTFWWRVSSQASNDYLRFYIDGTEQTGRISGTTGTWAQKTFTVTSAGAHTFKWSYTKNASTSSGSDCGWVDDVVWTPKLITTHPASMNILGGLGANLSVAATGTGLTYQWYFGDRGVVTNPIPGAVTSSYTTPALSATAKYWVRVGNGVGYEASNTATLTVSTMGTPLQIWRQTHFGAYDNAGNGADLNDFEHDGIPNLLEFAFGLDPKQNSAGQIPQAQRSGDNFVITFTQPTDVSGVTYGAEWSTALLPGSWTSIPNSSTPPQHTFSVPIESRTKLYMRLKVSAP